MTDPKRYMTYHSKSYSTQMKIISHCNHGWDNKINGNLSKYEYSSGTFNLVVPC